MELPILQRLKDGEHFDFVTLADNIDQTEEFWQWWWSERPEDGRISRPEIIDSADPILEETIGKPTVNLSAYSEFFDTQFMAQIEQHSLPLKLLPREHYRQILIRILFRSHSILLRDQPQVVFAGGGYGSGKTTTLNRLGKIKAIPVGMGHLVGADIFKQLIPEFNLIKAVADGRASVTVQKECKSLARDLFEQLIQNRRSFIWDSSMSDDVATMEQIAFAAHHGYALTLIAVLTPLEVAIKQAMRRAFQSRRFPHPDALPASHKGFRDAFDTYLPHFEKVLVFAKDAARSEDCFVVAEKTGRTNPLAIHDEEMFSRARSL